MVEQEKLYKVGSRKRQTAQDRYADFFPDRFKDVLELYFSQRETTDDGNAGLRARISSCIHQHGDIGSQDYVGCKGIFIACDDRACECSGNHEKKQPWHALSVCLEDTDLEIRLVGRDDSGHLFDILGGLFFQNVDYVIDGDNTDETVLVIDNGHGGKVVFLEHLRRFFLVGKRVNTDDVVVHDLDDQFVIGFEKKIAESYGADKFSSLVENVADIDCLGI